MKKIIGILGGIGPESTGRFYLNLIENFQNKFRPENNTQYPQIIINSIPAPELIYDRVDKQILDYYTKSLKQLESNNCDFMVIVCNTAYCFLDEFQKEVKTPIINLSDEVRNYLLGKKVKTATRLVSSTGYSHNLYKFSEIKYNELTDEEVKSLEGAIANFNIGKDKKIQTEKAIKIYEKYSAKSDVVILGCSELACMLKNGGKNTIDPLDLLVDATLRNL